VSATNRSETPVVKNVVGNEVSHRDELNGYVFWGLVALFIGVPDVMAASSNTLKADIPWPTISNLVGNDLQRHHHWVALLIVGLIVVVTIHAYTYPPAKKNAGRAVRDPSETVHVRGSRWYIVFVAAAAAGAGLVASALGATKNELGYAMYITLAITGVVIPSALAYWWNRVLAIPTLFAALAYLRARAAWVAALVVALLVVLLFHLALYPWPNYQFGGP
jgi:hypothetical protein